MEGKRWKDGCMMGRIDEWMSRWSDRWADKSGYITRNHRFINRFNFLKFGAKHLENRQNWGKCLVGGLRRQEQPVKHKTFSSS